MAWTNINKPTGPTYTNLNTVGKQQYDQADLTYDDATTYYDGTNPNLYTNVSKPTLPSWTNISKPV